MKEYKQAIIIGAAPMGKEKIRLLGLLKWAGLLPLTEEERKKADALDCTGSCKTCQSACDQKEMIKDIYIVAADGGLQFLQKHRIMPDYWVGDMDSFCPAKGDDLQAYTTLIQGIPHEKVPVEKDDTDTALAVKKAYEEGYREMLLFGCSGGSRISHTFANVQLMCRYEKMGCHIKMMGETFQAEILRNGKTEYAKALRGSVSVICLSDVAKHVVIKGLKYEYEGDLSNQFALGVSNSFIGKEGLIQVEEGELLLIYERE